MPGRLPQPPPSRGAHSLLRWQRFRASCRARSTRCTLSLVELQPMRPMRRTWEEKGECLRLVSPVSGVGDTQPGCVVVHSSLARI